MARTIVLLIVITILLPLFTFKLDSHHLSEVQINMVHVSLTIAICTGLLCFTVAELTNNCSQVDKIWSIMPIVYTWYFASAGGWEHRLMLMAICATVWGVRLTYNFGRKGAYRLKFWEGEEDYRWEVLRQNPMFKGHPWRFKLFNLFFISLYQNTLIWLFTLPAVMAYSENNVPLIWADYLLAGLFIGLVILEAIADQQQWDYQQQKRNKSVPVDDAGFVRTGLWKYVRHPNYACEQLIWIVFYFFSVIPEGRWVNWSMAGCLLLLILFQASSDFSEGISKSKYPLYADYVRRTPRFVPRLW